MIKSSVFGFLATVMVALPAFAAPISTQPTAPVASGGDVNVVFIGSDAGDASGLFFGSTALFHNKAEGAYAAAISGQVINLGALSGPLNFSLRDYTVANTFDLQSLASDNYYHAVVSEDYASLGLFALSSAANDAIAALTQLGGIVSFVGFEDRTNGDYDYNDFVFAVVVMPPSRQTPDEPQGPTLLEVPAPVPEPASLFLMGAGLTAFAVRRRRQA